MTPQSRWTPSGRSGFGLGLLSLALALTPPAARAQDPQLDVVKDLKIEQKLGDQVPLDLAFTDEDGKSVTLGQYFGERPVVLVMAYYECPMLCTLVLNGVVTALNVVGLDLGKDYDVVTVSIDPKETPALATAKKKTYVKAYLHDGAEKGWHFLTGQSDSIHKLTSAVGFHYQYDPKTEQFAHAAGIMVATPEGRLSKYFYGIEFSARDLRLGLIDASQHRIGTTTDQLLLWCFHYDPVTGKYGLAIMGVLRSLSLLTVGALLTFVIRALRRERVRQVHQGASK